MRDKNGGDGAAVSRLTQQVEIARDTFAGLIMVSRSFVFTAAGALVGLFSLAPVLLLVVAPPLVAGVSPATVALLPVPIVALFFGWLPHNDVAYDSTAIWMHIASGTRGIADRVGRLVPVVLITVPLLAILIPVTVALHGRWAVLPALTGVAAVLFLSALGLSSIASAAAPYAAMMIVLSVPLTVVLRRQITHDRRATR